MRHYYTPYVRNSLRYFVREDRPDDSDIASQLEWDACDRALSVFSKKEQDVLVAIYENRDTIADNVYAMSLDLHVPQKQIWRLIERLERRVARERGIEG